MRLFINAYRPLKISVQFSNESHSNQASAPNIPNYDRSAVQLTIDNSLDLSIIINDREYWVFYEIN